MFYRIWLNIYELFHFGTKSWWWKVRFLFLVNYFFFSTYRTVKKESAEFEYCDGNFIYGETPCITVKRILDCVEYMPGDIFIDLGSGRGMVVFYAYFLGNLETRGYELIPSFIRKSRKIADSLGADKIHFFQEDILEADISKAKIIFIAGTTFPEDFIAILNRKLRQATEGSTIITLSYKLPDSFFNLYRESILDFSWGRSHVYFHRRRNKKGRIMDYSGNHEPD